MDGGHEWWERRRRRPLIALPMLVGVIQVVGSTIADRGDTPALTNVAYALLLVGPVALVARRRWPLVVLAVCLAAAVGYLVSDLPRGPFFIAAIVALFGAVRRSNRVAVWVLCGLAYATVIAIGRPPLGEAVVLAAWSTAAVVLAEFARVRGEHFAEMARTRAEAARARQEQSRRQASDERLRIARELHDVLGHHLSLINVRAGVALHLLDSKPEQAREALAAIKVASAEGLREVRGVLAALSPQQEGAPRSPAPGLADIDHLAEEARAGGRSVSVRLEGQRRPVPGEVERAAYRIVQESLTNVRRHAGDGAAVTVTIAYEPHALSLRIDDTGVGQSTSDNGSGNGIPGMQERATALGGTLTTHERPDGGFRVEASLPLGVHDTDETLTAHDTDAPTLTAHNTEGPT